MINIQTQQLQPHTQRQSYEDTKTYYKNGGITAKKKKPEHQLQHAPDANNLRVQSTFDNW